MEGIVDVDVEIPEEGDMVEDMEEDMDKGMVAGMVHIGGGESEEEEEEEQIDEGDEELEGIVKRTEPKKDWTWWVEI
jgi:hypothetical protein